MNERIRELAYQAGFYINPDFEHPLTKFAQLIVKECIQVSEAHAKDLESQPTDPLFETLTEAYEDGVVDGIYEATVAIKEHFGVEE
jgi:hypothetical protein